MFSSLRYLRLLGSIKTCNPRNRTCIKYFGGGLFASNMSEDSGSCKTGFPKKFTDGELRKKLTPEQYSVTQKSGTERAFTGKYWNNHANGIYKCVVCEEDLFDSETKFESGSGWPSFYDVLDKGKVKLVVDESLFMSRTEVLCGHCGSHLGHVFKDGPAPTGQRYCMNSASLEFKSKESDQSD